MTQSNLAELLLADPSSGPLWGAESEDLNCTFLAWEAGQGVASHRNDEVDVAMLVLSGSGEATVDGEAISIKQGTVLVIPKGAERSIRAIDRLAYLNVHRRRRKLMPGPLKR